MLPSMTIFIGQNADLGSKRAPKYNAFWSDKLCNLVFYKWAALFPARVRVVIDSLLLSAEKWAAQKFHLESILPCGSSAVIIG